MNTALRTYTLGESISNKSDYLVPKKLPFELQEDSKPYDSGEDKALSTVSNKSLSDKVPKTLLSSRFMAPLTGKFSLLQLWEGRIVQCRDSEFDAIITDKTNLDFPDEFVTIDVSEITPDDFPLVKEGAVFYWSVGYLDYPGRGRIKGSKIRFRRLKGWTKKEIEYAKGTAKKFADFFKSDSVLTSQA